jgi:uncharacterized protein YpmS
MTEEKPPILKTWKNLYALVIAVLVILIVVFYLFTKHFK